MHKKEKLNRFLGFTSLINAKLGSFTSLSFNNCKEMYRKVRSCCFVNLNLVFFFRSVAVAVLVAKGP